MTMRNPRRAALAAATLTLAAGAVLTAGPAVASTSDSGYDQEDLRDPGGYYCSYGYATGYAHWDETSLSARVGAVDVHNGTGDMIHVDTAYLTTGSTIVEWYGTPVGVNAGTTEAVRRGGYWHHKDMWVVMHVHANARLGCGAWLVIRVS